MLAEERLLLSGVCDIDAGWGTHNRFKVFTLNVSHLAAAAAAAAAAACQVSLGDAELDGFRVKIIDTCGLEDPEAGDTVNYTVSS
jgi:hypothetical protein